QPGWGPSTIRPPPDTPPPPGGAGVGADPTGPDEGMVAQPVASSVARTAPSSSANRMRAGVASVRRPPSAIAATFRQAPVTSGPALAAGRAPVAGGRLPAAGRGPVAGRLPAAGRGPVAGGQLPITGRGHVAGGQRPVTGRAPVTIGPGGGRDG